ncbi:MAG: UPF0262 family protein [Proteobacteria bacterium]|nr:UPF0262 family protein [Pseudomonadota bacterium]
MALKNTITAITLDDNTITRLTPEIQHEREVTVADLVENNQFTVTAKDSGLDEGPYRIHISMQEQQRLLFHIQSEANGVMWKVPLGLKPFRGMIKDYFLVCESYYEAIKTASPQKIEAIDMGRRSLHNEGSELLQKEIGEGVEMDFDTARRLFTLICVLHIK